MTIEVCQARGRDEGGGANLCIANDAIPVFYCYAVAICYVVVKSFLKRTSKFDKLRGGVGGFVGEELQAVGLGLLVIVCLHV